MKRTISVTAFVLLNLFTFAQDNQEIPPTNVAKKALYGFSCGYNASKLTLDEVGTYCVSPINGYGINLGVVMDYHLTPTVFLNPDARLVFHRGKLIYETASRPLEVEVETEVTNVEFSLHIGYKLKGKKCRPYVLAGPNFKVNTISEEELNPNQIHMKMQPHDLATDIGAGMVISLPHFVIAPELRYSIGMVDINGSSAYFYNTSIANLRRNSLMVILNFKG